MVRKFQGKVSGEFENCWIFEMQTIQPKIEEAEWNVTEITIKEFMFWSNGKLP